MKEMDWILATRTFVKAQLPLEPTGHDFHHAFRVEKLATFIAQQEGVNSPIVALAALLHDIADWKFHEGDLSKGPEKAREFLGSIAVPRDIIEGVVHVIENISFKGALVANPMRTPEGFIVQDADRLDALGAIGIARTFAYGGFIGQPIYDPEQAPQLHDSFTAYQGSKSSTINHFYEKLLRLEGMMNTETGQVMAASRTQILKQFLEQFYSEWDGHMPKLGSQNTPDVSTTDIDNESVATP